MVRVVIALLVGFLFLVVSSSSVGMPTEYKVYLPIVQFSLDPRVGITEYDCQEMESLGFPCGVKERYHSEYWGMPSPDNTFFFVRSAHRCLTWWCTDIPSSWPTDLYCKFAYRFEGEHDFCAGETATETGLVDPVGMCEFLAETGASVIVGNEEAIQENNGISSAVTPDEYAMMYRDTWQTIKACSPTTGVGPYAPLQQGTDPTWAKDYFEAWHAAYHTLTGDAVPQDFQAVHYYAWPNFEIEAEIAKVLTWKVWLAERAEIDTWILTEYGIPCWMRGMPKDGPDVERFMEQFTCWLWESEEFQAWAWWPECTLLYSDGRPTPAGALYRSLSAGSCSIR